jgi:hypothetical protein
VAATALIFGLLIYLGGWLAHDARELPGGAANGWTRVPRWLLPLLRHGSGPIRPFPLVAQLLGLVFVARFVALSGAIPADPFVRLTGEAVTVAILFAGVATLWIYFRSRRPS